MVLRTVLGYGPDRGRCHRYLLTGMVRRRLQWDSIKNADTYRLFKCFQGANQSEPAQAPKADLVTRIKARVAAADPKKAQELGGVFLFNIIKGSSVYSWSELFSYVLSQTR